MVHSSENDPLSFWNKESSSNPPVGIVLFEAAFDFYAWYLSYDLTPSKHHRVFESLSLLMQMAKLSFEGACILSIQEEAYLLKELREFSDALSSGMFNNHDLVQALEKMLRKLTDANPKARLIAALVRLEYKICCHNENAFNEVSHATFKQLIQNAFEKISPTLPDLIASTLSRELEALLAKPLDAHTFLQEFHNSIALLKHAY